LACSLKTAMPGRYTDKIFYYFFFPSGTSCGTCRAIGRLNSLRNHRFPFVKNKGASHFELPSTGPKPAMLGRYTTGLALCL